MKQRSLMKRVSAVLLAAALTISTFPQMHTNVYAAENQLPTKEQFATVEELKSFNTNDNDGERNPAKIYFGNNNQQWWIAGSQKGNLTLFAASPLLEEQQFEPIKDKNKTYLDSWNCDYGITGFSNPNEVYSNHYGGSEVRIKLQELERSFFSDIEKTLMNKTTILTEDGKNKSTYATTDKLYLPVGYYKENYITAGINNGLRIDNNYWIKDRAWLRTPKIDELIWGSSQGVTWHEGTYVTTSTVNIEEDVVPVFELNLSSVIFASLVPKASSEGQLSENDAFTLRYSANNLGSAFVPYAKNEVQLNDVPKGTYLVVQNSNGAIAKSVSGTTSISASDMNLDSFANCKVWLETTDTANRITYAALAEQEKGTAVNITASTGLNITSNNGTQEVAPNTAITDITVEVANGYYLSDDYISNLKSQLNGLKVTETDNGFTISGTPTSDVNITLPAATVLPKADKPIVNKITTATSITIQVNNYKAEFGDIEYQWDNNGKWEKDKNVLKDLEPNTTHQIAVRYTGNGFYQMSDVYNAEVTTLKKDGDSVIVVPTNLETTYKEGLSLSEVVLPADSGWSWVNGDTKLSAGIASYLATFDTTALENTHDFSDVEGYDANTHKVTRKVEVKVNKAVSSISITNSLDKAYDEQVVRNPEYATSGSDGKVTILWQESKNGQWEDLKSAPSTVGSYRVVVELAGNDNYNSASTTLDFVISKATNTWVEELSITGWTYKDKANVPTSKAQFGDVTFTYSSEENGTYTNEVPKNAGTYYVKATVAGTENYTGLESVVSFEIAKAIPAYEKVTGLVLGQGQALSEIELPDQFKWVDETMTADELGKHTFKAVYTPEDTANYQTIEVEIEVEVVPTPIELNHVPTISASDKTITVGDKFDPMKDVTANDNEDGDLTNKIEILKNEVDTTKTGTYEVTYQVTDSQGATVTKTIKVTVKSVPVSSDTDKPDNDKNDGSIETGDGNHLLLWEVLWSGSGIILLYSLYRKKRKKDVLIN